MSSEYANEVWSNLMNLNEHQRAKTIEMLFEVLHNDNQFLYELDWVIHDVHEHQGVKFSWSVN